MRSMFVQVPMQTGYGQITRVEVSLPYVAALIADDSGKYYMEPKRLEGTELRRHQPPRADVALVGEAGAGMRQRRADGRAAEAAL